ncbi:EscU/YscU/HrcU family type III secretion system export apparatus switch protein [Erwinia amylovora]|uniref:Surface presentation of antigens protein SpaS n=2 Tax=Erwinia amylovora TaxID=552 RepID=A0A831A096_ERWAM|nr:EscU/YscU/HrcU family type III secretion system export apparatus switch protein [Erwinia amylovora]ATZ12419.1 EscU/YscU/HrcU family type III secretion system export apparatus switch protein [Erwinia amylovora]EKV55071.1 Surface presentation of antigens protein SpaS [Erwinia amylovora ACW56400]MBZ2390184.1 EscU/YscU/HrcU family type III secretion system export apparatus switch protein [Erwinia amylovora]MBZ2397071.1 EscU/YscU/HrcU family type III secretion system export apparatus switch prote
MAEKTEKPTDKRRRDSAKKGQTFKSKDLITTVTLLTGGGYLAYVMDFRSFTSFYSLVLREGDKISLNDFLTELMRVFLNLSLPFIAVCTVAGAVMTLLQTRFSIATEAIKLNFEALDPVKGLKKIFSMRTIKELVKSIFYLVVFICTCYNLIHGDLIRAVSIYNGSIEELISVWITLTIKAVMVFIGWSAFVLIIDFFVEYFLHFKDMKMDKHEVKQEHKESDGNPEIKGARRRAHHEILSGEDMAAIRNSEVVMANPTHIAIAIYFNPEVASLPFIALRSTNMKAKAAIAYAEKIGIPVVRYIPLTRRLYHTYSQHSFISLHDDSLMEVMDILIWLRQVETAGMELPASSGVKKDEDAPGSGDEMQDKPL